MTRSSAFPSRAQEQLCGPAANFGLGVTPDFPRPTRRRREREEGGGDQSNLIAYAICSSNSVLSPAFARTSSSLLIEYVPRRAPRLSLSTLKDLSTRRRRETRALDTAGYVALKSGKMQFLVYRGIAEQWWQQSVASFKLTALATSRV